MRCALGLEPCKARRVSGPVEVALRRDDGLPRRQQLAHRHETIALFLELGDGQRERVGGMPAAPIGVGDDDGAGMRLAEDGVEDRLGRSVRIGIAGDDVPLDGESARHR